MGYGVAPESCYRPVKGLGEWMGKDTMPLRGIRVLDSATLFAGPLAATMLADFGADVIKIEHPKRGDPSRGHGPAKDGVGLWWKMLNRSKRTIGLNLSDPDGREVFLSLIHEADVYIENFRPDTLEKWDLGYDMLKEVNPGLVLVRVTGFGQVGPRRRDAGFGTIAEAMSGFAAMTGEPDGPPTLPPLALADGIAALATAYAVMVALKARETTGRGQVVDMAIIEPILTVLGPLPTVYDQLGIVPERTGNRSTNNAPRNTYRTRDGRWVAISTSAQAIAERVMHLVGRSDVIEKPWFASGRTRAEHADELDAAVGGWIAERDAEEVLNAFSEAQASASLVYDIKDVMSDPQYRALGTITEVEDEELSKVKMQNVIFRLSETPGEVRWAGRSAGHDTNEVLAEFGHDKARIAELRNKGVIS